MKQTMVWFLMALVLGGCAGRHVDYQSVSWKKLASLPYGPKVKRSKPLSVPPAIASLNGASLRLSGYMLPVEMDGENVATFILVRNQAMCCFGRTPEMNEWVMVRFRGGSSVPMNMDRPISVSGNFEVGEELEEGAVVSLYRMVAERVEIDEGKPAGWQARHRSGCSS